MPPFINRPESMERAIREMGIIPFFSNRIPGYSIQEMTAPGCWFGGDDDPLGPWDWKIECLHCGDIAYGKKDRCQIQSLPSVVATPGGQFVVLW